MVTAIPLGSIAPTFLAAGGRFEARHREREADVSGKAARVVWYVDGALLQRLERQDLEGPF